ncbi:MAG: PD-(D/E)XK nuclease family protein [Rickettsiales bacterium]|jgi:ATP-dependent helicase/nuclease subunit A|nr:PD-(D/E)XK nuclease family protein [Rickettsiales bacterium]
MKSENLSLSEFMASRKKQKFATGKGREIHSKMRGIVIDSGAETGNRELIEKIKSNPALPRFFASGARAEVPIAGMINGKFVSRRIDRLVVSESEKSIVILDYKTDSNKEIFRAKYTSQMSEYLALLGDAYPGYSIRGFILWLNDFTMEEIDNHQFAESGTAVH